MKKYNGLGLVTKIVPDVQKCELQLWKSLVWIRSEFNRMVEHILPATMDAEGKLKLIKAATVDLSMRSHDFECKRNGGFK